MQIEHSLLWPEVIGDGRGDDRDGTQAENQVGAATGVGKLGHAVHEILLHDVYGDKMCVL